MIALGQESWIPRSKPIVRIGMCAPEIHDEVEPSRGVSRKSFGVLAIALRA